MCNCNCSNGVCSADSKRGCHSHHCMPIQIAYVLVLIGGLNWGLTGLGMLMGTNLNLVNLLLGSMPTLESIIYLVVGLATLAKIVGCRCKTCKGCSDCSKTTTEAPKAM